MAVSVFKMTYVGVDDRISTACQYPDFVEVTESDTYEVWASDIRRMEDELAERRALTSGEYFEPTITEEQASTFKSIIGEEVYDMLLNEELDVVLLVNM